MAVAQGINKNTTIIKQASLGTPGAGGGGQALRRTSSVFQYNRAMFKNLEINPDQQSRGDSYGLKSVQGKFAGLLSPATYKLWMASALRKDFTAGVSATGASITIAGAGPSYTVTRAAGSYLVDGFKIGDVIQLSVGSFNAANLAKNLLIISLSATVATVIVLNGVALVPEGPIATSTVAVVGKKTLAPLTGQTNDYFTVEEWYSDLSKSELFTDVKVSKMMIKVPGSGNCVFDCDLVGLGRTLGNSQVLTTPTAATTTSVLTAVNGVVYVNGVVAAVCTGFDLTVDDMTTVSDAVIASSSGVDLNRGVITVSGQLTALFDGTTIQTIYTGETPVGVTVVAAADQTASAAFMGFTLSRIKFTGDAPDDNAKAIVRTYPFTAEININGGATLANDQTILSIQDSAA